MINIADKIRTAQDKDGMLRRALERIIQLYTDKSHFVYELLQNAEDAEAKSIKFIQYPDRLEVFHDGRPFTSANLQGLCDIGKSDKADNLNQIGEFGVGFKSVFGICDTVRLYSAPDHFREPIDNDAVPFAVEILDFTRPEDIPGEPMQKAYTTRFVFPYTVGQTFSGFSSIKALNDTLTLKLQNLGITTLLFMKNLELIEYEIEMDGEPIKGEYLLHKEEINDHCLLVYALGTAEQKRTDGTSDELISYLKFSRPIMKYAQRTVDIAFPIRIDKNGDYQCIKAPSPYVSVYFPTETESKLDFIVQGPYRTTPNRSSIPADDEDNMMLAQETAVLLRQSILELKETGKLNMSFIKALPLSEERFDTFPLFFPLFTMVRELFRTTAVIPSKSGQYVSAQYAKISRQEQLAIVLTDELLTQLINDGHQYYWLSPVLTETNREYKPVRDFFTGELNISVIIPEDLRRYFALNPKFLPEQSNAWLVSLYNIFENIPAAFSKSKNEANLAIADIVKTSTGIFVAPFRRDGKAYIPNVFLPSQKIHSSDIHFVDQSLCEQCRHFFDDILQLQKPNEYEFFIKDIRNRYSNGYVFNADQHAEDIRMLLKFIKYDDYKDEVTRIIKEILVLRCNDDKLRSTNMHRIFLPITPDGINIEAYYRNSGQNVYFVDLNFYESHDIETKQLVELSVHDTLLVGANIVQGTYDTGSRGKSPEWWTTGDFRWKLSIDALKEVLKYISDHPTAKDTLLKSQAIMKILAENDLRLCGRVYIGGYTIPNLENEPCEMIHILRGDRMIGWNGKWLFTESGEIVSPKDISKHDLNPALYGRMKPDSNIFNLLGFMRTEADEIDDLKKTVPKEKLDAFFESELRQRYGISCADLNAQYGASCLEAEMPEDAQLPFPTLNVRSWDALRKHAAEMLIYADPVRYEERVRSIRVSNRPREAKAYLQNMYRHEGNNRFKFACQLCHDTCSAFEATEIFLHPETELDPIHLCLCPNCAARYRTLRANSNIMQEVRKVFLAKNDADIEAGDYVDVSIDDDNVLWFTQTHFAEIRELMRLTEEIKNRNSAPPIQVSSDDENEKPGMSVYSEYIGKTIRRRDGFIGTIADVTTNGKDTYLVVTVTGGKDIGKQTKIQLAFIIKNRNVYSISEK
ncbi:MAG: hypothetical protein IKH57_20290 [Clostridia bacterium]|nr:hypothetical protein [Clostridia bacterium]